MSKLSVIALSAAMALSLTCEAQRDVRTINSGWFFKLAADSAWSAVNIPHTYNSDAYTLMDYYQGKGFYRKPLTIPEVRGDRRYYLKFDAASKAADVTVNGLHAVSHPGGYSTFVADITPLIQKENLIEVTVDNSNPDIAPLWADFTFWGGIYRDVWLIETADRHFNMNNHGSAGIFISTPEVNEKQAEINIRCEVTNDRAEKTRLNLINRIYGPDGSLVSTLREPLKINAGETLTASKSVKISAPALWSPENPQLYKVVSTLEDASTGEVVDRQEHNTGLRWFSFDGRKGFSLNGKRYKLRGVNRHQDMAPAGVALDDEAHRRDIALIKETGCNFIRIAHYQQDDALLDECDRLGLLVWEETPNICKVPDTPGYDDNSELAFTDMIRQHFNHPSVIAWGYMNEILLHAPSSDSPEWPALKERTVRLARRLEKKLHEEDPGRVSVMAFSMSERYNEIGLNLVDVTGWNLYQGWYVGQLGDFDTWVADQQARYPDQPVIISEWGAGSDRRIHSLSPKAFDFSTEYQQKYIEHYLPVIEQNDYISGCSYWNFIDFNVAARQESMPRVNNKGLFYNNRRPKDVAYYFKSMWRADIPVIRIATRDWTERHGAEGQKHNVKIYSNLPEVELTVNGAPAGRMKTENCSAVFSVALPYGESTLRATGCGTDGKTAEDVATIKIKPQPDIAAGDELAVNAGSDCAFTSDVSHLTWLPDQPYTEGGWGYISGEPKSTTSEITGTPDGPVYQTWRENLEGYRFDVAAGRYEVELLMADASRSGEPAAFLLGRGGSGAPKADSRFSISICGRQVETDFSPADGGNYRRAFRRRYIVDNENGCVDVVFTPIEGKPHLAGIKIRKL